VTTAIPGEGFSSWLQIIVVACAILSLVGGALAFLLVIWPSIRRADRRAERLEKWIEGPDGRLAYQKFIDFLNKGAIQGSTQGREAFLAEDTGKGEVRGKI